MKSSMGSLPVRVPPMSRTGILPVPLRPDSGGGGLAPRGLMGKTVMLR